MVAPAVAAASAYDAARSAALAAGKDERSVRGDATKAAAVAAGGATAVTGATIGIMKGIETAAPVVGRIATRAAPAVIGGLSAKAAYTESRAKGDTMALAGIKAAGAGLLDTATAGLGMMIVRSGPENMGAEFRPSAAVRNRASTIGSEQASFEASNQAFSVMRSAGPKTRHVWDDKARAIALEVRRAKAAAKAP